MRSFTHGLVLAGLPVLVFLGVDYLIAPPVSVGTASSPLTTSVREGVARLTQAVEPQFKQAVAPVLDVTPRVEGLASTRPRQSSGRAADGAASYQTSLTASIQDELKRVGCYAGEANGSWNAQTQAAMKAFNTSVHVNLGTERPDYILLTLLQGHSAKACSRTCDSDPTRAGTCVDKSIEARAVPASGPTAVVAAQSAGEARLSSGVVATPIPSQKAPAATVVQVSPTQAAVASPSVRNVWETKSVAPAPKAVGDVQTGAVPGATPLPGRMAIGAFDGPGALPEAQPVPSALPAPAPLAQSVKQPRPATTSSRGSAGPAAPSRLSRTFSDLGRNSP